MLHLPAPPAALSASGPSARFAPHGQDTRDYRGALLQASRGGFMTNHPGADIPIGPIAASAAMA